MFFLKKKFLKSLILYSSLIFLLEGCHYQIERYPSEWQRATLSIPYIEGDEEGALTSEVIKQITASGLFHYINTASESDFLLKIEYLKSRIENVGFRYESNKHGKLKKFIIPSETRVHATIAYTLLENTTHKIVKGPITIEAYTTFDHEYDKVTHHVNQFSLGQLTNIEEAQKSAMLKGPLNRILASKIVESLKIMSIQKANNSTDRLSDP